MRTINLSNEKKRDALVGFEGESLREQSNMFLQTAKRKRTSGFSKQLLILM